MRSNAVLRNVIFLWSKRKEGCHDIFTLVAFKAEMLNSIFEYSSRPILNVCLAAMFASTKFIFFWRILTNDMRDKDLTFWHFVLALVTIFWLSYHLYPRRTNPATALVRKSTQGKFAAVYLKEIRHDNLIACSSSDKWVWKSGREMEVNIGRPRQGQDWTLQQSQKPLENSYIIYLAFLYQRMPG